MIVLTGGLRVIGGNYGDSKLGVLTDKPGSLTNAYFVNLMDMSNVWKLADPDTGVFNGKDRKTGALKWTATTHDLILGSNSELRSVAFAYASKNANAKFTRDFIQAWNKVMNR
jgi:catalase-peroxidase